MFFFHHGTIHDSQEGRGAGAGSTETPLSLPYLKVQIHVHISYIVFDDKVEFMPMPLASAIIY